MEHCGTEILQPTSQFNMTHRRIKLQEAQLPLDVVQHCSSGEAIQNVQTPNQILKATSSLTFILSSIVAMFFVIANLD